MDRKQIFWETIASYNSGTAPVQAAVILTAIVLVAIECISPGRKKAIALKSYMAVLNFWIGIAYYIVFGSGRDYNALMSLLWMIMGVMWLYDIGRSTEMQPWRRSPSARLSIAVMLLPVIYPVMSIAIGREWPMMTTPVMPCSAAVFNVGVMMMFYRKVNIVMAMMLCHWSLAGLAKVYSYGIIEDYILGIGVLPAAVMLLRRYIRDKAHVLTKPSPGILRLMFSVIVLIIFAAFTYSLIQYMCR